MTLFTRLIASGLIAALLTVSATAQNYPTPFANNKHSATAATTWFEYEITDSMFYDVTAAYQMIYRDAATSTWQSQSMAIIYAACTTWTVSGALTYTPPSGELEYYFRAETDTLVVSQSPANSTNTFPAPEATLADMGADPTGDAVGALGQWLDITGLSMTYSSTRIYARLTNAGGGFPTSSGLNFFLYSVGIVDPDGTDSAAYAMIYVNVPFVLSSGLYRINPLDSSFTKVGNISTNISGNNLSLACNISDLLTQPGWSSWPPPSGFIMSAPVTGTQNLSTLTMNDMGKGCALVPQSQSLPYAGNLAPTLANDLLSPQTGTLSAAIDFADADDNLAVLRQFRLLNHGTYDMTACVKSYAVGATFDATATFDTSGWYQYSFAFSDGIDSVVTTPQVIYLEVAPQYVPGDANGDNLVSISDAVYLINYIFAGGPAPDPLASGDANCDAQVSISDAVYIINYIFAGGPAPCAP